MKVIKEIIIVEGKHDKAFLETFLDAFILVTDGSSIPDKTKQLIKELSKNNSFIVLTDPDYPGSYIRNEILKIIPDAKVGFIRKGQVRHKGTIGVENATKEEVLNALDNLITYTDYQENITQLDLLDLGLTGNKDSSNLRNVISSKLMIGECNTKTFLKRINMLNISVDDLTKLVMENR